MVGKNNRLYTVDTQGKTTVWTTSPLAPLWNVNLSVDLSTRDVSPTLDCKRDASGAAVTGLGTLYVAAVSKLYAFIIEEPGFDSGANAWPKFQHDARNTGNPATPITACP